MRYGLGIDTGGTYTDAVIFDFNDKTVVASAKSITVKEDLTVGICGAIDGLPAELLPEVRLVALSTTLATNACVEGKGSRAKLVMIGCDEEIAARYGREYGLPETGNIIFLDGGHDQQGEVKREPDWNLLKDRVEECRHETDGFAVVELWGIRNPDFERKAKTLITGWTGVQTVCGCELTGEINSLKRAASALLNAQLVPIIKDFLTAVKTSLERKNVRASLVIVRGDGSLMSEEFAGNNPVETLLCGPAASVAGGLHLSGEKDCVIVDMGGTTSDIAVVKNGIPKLTREGAQVGTWRTGIQSILIDTVGLGGDSLIRHRTDNGLSIGPGRAAPLSWMAARWPSALGSLEALYRSGKRDEIPLCEYLYAIRDIADEVFYTAAEKDIVGALGGGPLNMTELADAMNCSIVEIRTKRLEQHGVIQRCGLTPTDIMHLTGDFTGWDRNAARLGAAIMAHQIGASVDDVIRMVGEHVKEKLYCSIVKMLMEDGDESLLKSGISGQIDSLMRKSFRQKRHAAKNRTEGAEFLECGFSTPATLVGIGAPIHLYLPDVAKALGAAFVVPKNAGVANAVGAITGNVMVEESVLIRPQYAPAGITGYRAFSSLGNQVFHGREDAVEWAKKTAYEMVGKSAVERGAEELKIFVKVDDSEADISASYASGLSASVGSPAIGDEGASADDARDPGSAASIATEPRRPGPNSRLLIETVVTAQAIGKIKWT